MATFSFTVSVPSSGSGGSQSQEAADAQVLFGKDLYYDVRAGSAVDLHVTPAGDWAIVEGYAALSQSLIRRMITDPGEWVFRPEYGAGLRRYVKERRTSERVSELRERVRAQALADDRVESVADVVVEFFEGGLKLLLAVRPKGGPARNGLLTIGVEVS